VNAEAQIVPDSQHRGLVAALPQPLRNYALLARFDRPIGWWLLFWPCAWGVLLAGGQARWDLILWLLAGRDRDARRGLRLQRHRRRRSRPAGGAHRGAPARERRAEQEGGWAWLFCSASSAWSCCFNCPASPARRAGQHRAGRGLSLHEADHLVAASLARTGVFLGCAGRVDRAEARPFRVLAALYAASIAWVIGYDTIYALQDREDDALVGIRSSARRMGSRVRGGVATSMPRPLPSGRIAFWLLRPDGLALLALLPAAAHLAWQVLTLDINDGDNALQRFRANRFTGLLVALACWVVGNA
jgi:4-hydroxybenzoate polyprenyltransferase